MINKEILQNILNSVLSTFRQEIFVYRQKSNISIIRADDNNYVLINVSLFLICEIKRHFFLNRNLYV